MAAIFFVTAAALLFQVAQTRLFSAAFGYHLTYLVISVALLGVGWGATLSAVFDARSLGLSLEGSQSSPQYACHISFIPAQSSA